MAREARQDDRMPQAVLARTEVWCYTWVLAAAAVGIGRIAAVAAAVADIRKVAVVAAAGMGSLVAVAVEDAPEGSCCSSAGEVDNSLLVVGCIEAVEAGRRTPQHCSLGSLT